jgi:hypothetical protein
MITTPTTTAENLPEQPAVPSKTGWPPLWPRLALAVVMLVSIFMNFYQLGQNGFGNLYYAAAIRSTSSRIHANSITPTMKLPPTLQGEAPTNRRGFPSLS